MKAIALVDANNFYVSCERLFQPQLNGRPVIVLSNNDGCVVSRSQEAKAVGIPMGIPLFQIKDEIRKYGIQVYSSNYALYGDLSSRMHEAIGHFSNEIEIYSIDEAFATVEANQYSKSLYDIGIEIKGSVKRWTGIPTSIGIAPTKTLAKIAGDLAKKDPEGVFDLTNEALRESVLEKTDIMDIWGINTRTATKLSALGVHTASQLRDMDLRSVRRRLTVVGARLVDELRGIPCLPLEFVQPLKKTICCSRSFSSEVKTLGEMTESLLNHLSRAAEKMRRHKLVTNGLNIFIATNRFKDKGVYANSATVKINPTDSTRELIFHALRLLMAIYKHGFAYRKAGVILLGLEPSANETKRLFDDQRYLRDKALMGAIDSLNGKYGRKTLNFGLSRKEYTHWQMNRNSLSPRYTTDIHQILRIPV